jgi:hypothetical protein
MESKFQEEIVRKFENLEHLILLFNADSSSDGKTRLEKQLQQMELEFLKTLETLDELSFASLKAIPPLSTSNLSDLQFLQALADKYFLKLRSKKKQLVSKILERMAKLDQFCSQLGLKPVSQLHSATSALSKDPDTLKESPETLVDTKETHSRCSSSQDTLVGLASC